MVFPYTNLLLSNGVIPDIIILLLDGGNNDKY